MATDILAEINGVEPKVLLQDGEEREIKSFGGSWTYEVKRSAEHYECSCPYWQQTAAHVPSVARSCKHLMMLLGDDYEKARVEFMNPNKRSSSSKPTSSNSTKRKRGPDSDNNNDDDDNGDDSDDKPTSKRARAGLRTSPRKKTGTTKPTTLTTSIGTPQLLLAKKWDLETGLDPTGWWISEKLDGVRTYYDGKHFWSRLGNPFTPPKWFSDKLPRDVTLDGELFGGRGKFQETVSIVKTINSPHWQGIKFHIFDVPSMGAKPFEQRMEYLQKTFGPKGTHTSPHIIVVDQIKARGKKHVLEQLKAVETFGGEGLMLRKPKSQYEGRRSDTLLKVKTFYDAEAIIIGYLPGSGRHQGATGALRCKMASGKEFSVGSGLSDKQRHNPPKIGAIIVYRFQEITRDGMPRFPTFVGEALDKKKPKDADVPDHRKGSAKD